MTDVYRSYDSVADLVADATAAPVMHWNTLEKFDARQDNGWMCADRPHIIQMRQAPQEITTPLFPAGVARIERLSAQIKTPAPVSIRRRMTRGAEGDELDMQRVWQGDLDNAWTRSKRLHSVSASRVLIGVFVGAPGNEDSERVAWRGVAALALADALEAGGYTVNVRAFRRCNMIGFKAKHDVDVTIKADGEPLDVHKAANLIASTLLFRGVMLRHALVTAQGSVGPGISQTDYSREEDLRDVAAYDFTCVAGRAVDSSYAAQRWIETQIKALDALNDAGGAGMAA